MFHVTYRKLTIGFVALADLIFYAAKNSNLLTNYSRFIVPRKLWGNNLRLKLIHEATVKDPNIMSLE